MLKDKDIEEPLYLSLAILAHDGAADGIVFWLCFCFVVGSLSESSILDRLWGLSFAWGNIEKV